MADGSRIEKSVVIEAPRWRVWRAIADAREFGSWFGAKVVGDFVEGQTIRGPITHPGYEHLTMEFTVERIEPERLFSFRWHPYAIDPSVDYSTEPTTLIEFHLEDTGAGTLLKIVESGFEQIPASRRAEALKMNEDGWEAQATNIQRHVLQSQIAHPT